MLRRVVAACVCLLPLSLLAGCPSKDGGSSIKVERTCKDAAGRYGEHLGNDLVTSPNSPIPAELKDKAKAAVKEAVVKSCEEDKWDELPLDCLAGAFEKPDIVPAKDFGKVLDVCAGGAGKDKTAKMDERLKQAMATLGKEARGAADSAAAPAAPSASTLPPSEPKKDDVEPPGKGAAQPQPGPKAAAPPPGPKPAPPKPPSGGDAF